MINTIGNPDLEFLFEEDSFKTRKKTQKEIELAKLYESIFVEMPEVGEIINATFAGQTKDNFIFSKPGYKDDIRVQKYHGFVLGGPRGQCLRDNGNFIPSFVRWMMVVASCGG